jgi:DHA3 family macrolide efflux protein-like MFS transporter
MGGLFGMGLGFVLVGLAPGGWLVMALAAMALAGSMNPIHGGPLFAALQATVAPEMQGRVLSLIGAATNVIVPVSLAIAGPLSDSVGPNWWYVVGGGMCIVLAGAAFGIRPLMQLEDQREADAGGGAEPSPISA